MGVELLALNGVGAFDDMGGKDALLLDVDFGLLLLPPNGVGAFDDIGGKDALLLDVAFGLLLLPPNGVGAFVDIGGKAEVLGEGFEGTEPPLNGVGAFVAIGGNEALDFDAVSSFLAAPLVSDPRAGAKENPEELVAPDPDVVGVAKVKPPVVGAAELPKENPPPDAVPSFFSEPSVDPPKENPLLPIELPEAAPPNEKPPAPMDALTAVEVLSAAFSSLALSSKPGRTVSQAGQTVLSPGFRQEHTEHFQLSLST